MRILGADLPRETPGEEPLEQTIVLLDEAGRAIQVRHVFPAGTVIPAREAAVVFGGGTPTGDFGNAAANGLVFTASSGGLSLNNNGDTVTLADDLGATVQSVSYGSEGIKLFIDGVLEDSDTYTGLRNSQPVSIGDFTDRHFSDLTYLTGFIGEVDAVRFSSLQ